MDFSEFAELRAFVFGLAVGASAGRLARDIVYVARTHGGRAAWDCAMGTAIAHFTVAVIVFACAARLETELGGQRSAYLSIASVVLLGLGAWLAGSALWPVHARPDTVRFADKAAVFSTAYRIALVAPLPLLLLLAFAGQLPLTRHWEDGPRYAAFIFLGSLVALSGYALIGRRSGVFPVAVVPRAASLASAVAIASLAIYGLAANV